MYCKTQMTLEHEIRTLYFRRYRMVSRLRLATAAWRGVFPLQEKHSNGLLPPSQAFIYCTSKFGSASQAFIYCTSRFGALAILHWTCSLTSLQSNTLWTKDWKCQIARKSKVENIWIQFWLTVVYKDINIMFSDSWGKTAEQLVNVAAEMYMDGIHALFSVCHTQ